MKVGEKVDSDHLPLIVPIKGGGREDRRFKHGTKKDIRLEWNEKKRRIFRKKYGERRERGDNVEKNWRSFSKKLGKTKKLVKKEVNKKVDERPKKRWWNEECRRNKCKVKEEMQKWRKREGCRKKCKKVKKEYKKLCENKKLQKKIEQTAYKVYASVLAERLKKDVEEKRILPQSQAGFRKDMGTVDQIYVLNYLINKKIEEKEGKMKETGGSNEQ
ncbi:axoneme-associated protein mst101(2)-like [Cardiocondyla obscurior]|uniref:axoneme-associated protein mst101(2)-like n=1 Tax=Cardiocondyla obscurior TaxID=286306 RepID=UPI00396569B5